MNTSYNNSIFEEAIKIIFVNKSKANSLRLSLIQNSINDNELILKVRQYLGEFEYDLNILYDIIINSKELIINHNNLNNSINNEEEKNNFSYNTNTKLNNEKLNLKKSNSFKSFRRHKKNFYLNNLEDFLDNSGDNNKKENKTYSLTINICDGRHYDSNQKKEKKKIINKSNSCKAFIRKNKFKKFGFLNNNKNKNITNSYRFDDMKYRNYLNNIYLNDLDVEDNIYNNLRKYKNNKDNNKHYTYMTDYSSHKNSYRNNLKHKHNLLNLNIEKNKNSLKNLNNIYDHFNALLNNNKRPEENLSQNKNENIENKINNILSLENPNHYSNLSNNCVPMLDFEKIHNNNRNSIFDNNYYDNKNLNSDKNKADTINYYGEEYNGSNNRRSNLQYNLSKNNNRITYVLNYDVSEKNKHLNDNNLNRHESMSNLYENNNTNNNEEILDENKKNEMIQNIISIILQDTNKLNHLQKYFGDDIGEKLLQKDINQVTLFKIVEILKNYQNNTKNNKNEKNLFRGSRKNYSNSKLIRKINNNIILKDTLNNNGHTNKEYPLGLFSINDYFN